MRQKWTYLQQKHTKKISKNWANYRHDILYHNITIMSFLASPEYLRPCLEIKILAKNTFSTKNGWQIIFSCGSCWIWSAALVQTPEDSSPAFWWNSILYSGWSFLLPLCVVYSLQIFAIRCHLVHKFSITEHDWYRIKQNIDAKCRAVWRKKINGLPLDTNKVSQFCLCLLGALFVFSVYFELSYYGVKLWKSFFPCSRYVMFLL